MKFILKKYHSILEILFYKCSILLLYLSFITYFIKNNPELSYLIISAEGLLILFGAIIVQLLFNFYLEKSGNYLIKFIYLDFIVISFVFLNLAYLLKYLEQLNIYTDGLIRIRFVLLLFFLLMATASYFAASFFRNTIRALNVFLIVFVITCILYTDYTVFMQGTKTKKTVYDSSVNLNFEMLNNFQRKEEKKKILFLVLDEYSSEADLIAFAKPDKMINSLNSYLLTRGFTVIRKIPSLELSTLNSINQLFNQGSELTFKDKSVENVGYELKHAFVVKNLAERGFKFKNFGLFNIGGNKEFYYLYPFPRNNFETLFKNSMLFLIVTNFTFQNLKNFNGFQIYADYNKKVYTESLVYLNNSKASEKEIIYVHFEMPHPPFYSINEFPHLSITLENYIEYWNFCNKKVIDYLNSIKDLDSYKVIITGDHGYRREPRKLDPHITTSAFYNFDSTELSQVAKVQDIGKLLLKQ
jgi:hypothetical protein